MKTVSMQGFPSVLLTDAEGLASMTSYRASSKLMAWLERIVLENYAHHLDAGNHSRHRFAIVDALAGIGGNTIFFAAHKRVERVVAIELNERRFDALTANVAQLSVAERSKVEPIHMDFIRWIKRNNDNENNHDSDSDSDSDSANLVKCIFIDPPWGGRSYKMYPSIRELYLYSSSKDSVQDKGVREDYSLTALCRELEKLRHCIDMLVFKLPFNFNIKSLCCRMNYSKVFVKKELNITFLAVVNH